MFSHAIQNFYTEFLFFSLQNIVSNRARVCTCHDAIVSIPLLMIPIRLSTEARYIKLFGAVPF